MVISFSALGILPRAAEGILVCVRFSNQTDCFPNPSTASSSSQIYRGVELGDKFLHQHTAIHYIAVLLCADGSVSLAPQTCPDNATVCGFLMLQAVLNTIGFIGVIILAALSRAKNYPLPI